MGLEGDPEAIAAAMHAAFHRGLKNFRTWARLSLFWLFLQNNFKQDGRYVDLEIPFCVGAPLGGWLDTKLRFLGGPVMRLDPMARSMLNGLHGAIGSQFRRDRHLLCGRSPVNPGEPA